MLPQEDYESMLETVRLLADKKSLKALLDSHEQREKGQEPHSYSVEEDKMIDISSAIEHYE